jgi:predicted RNase H-like HicB family nuclease/predicted XRE-type DNA-binding protein
MGDSGFIESSGNVFLDLGLSDAEELFAESGLAIAIVRILEERGVDARAVPGVLGVDERLASDLLSYRLDALSVRDLLDMLITLGQDIELVIRPTAHEWGRGGIFVTRCTTAKEPDDESRWRYPTTFSWSEGEQSWIGEARDLRGCIADGRTRAEARRNLLDVIEGWVETAREAGRPIPKPGSFSETKRDTDQEED